MMRVLLSLLLFTGGALANTCLSSASGNWNDSTKWTNCGGGVPVDGDTAKIAQGQTITIPAGYQAIVGLSAAGNTQAAATSTTLSAAITTTGQTAITVTSGTSIANSQYIILMAEGANTTEIVQVSAGGGTTSLTIVRAQQGTAASTHANAATVNTGSIPAISCNGNTNYGANGTGILAVNGTLTYRGNVEQCTAAWTVGTDAILEHDSSAASSPSTTHYRWFIGAYLFPDTAKLVIRGTSGHRALIRNATSSGTFYGFTGYFGAIQGTGQYDFEYTTIDGCGSSSTPCTDANSHTGAIAFIARCDHCLVTNSGYIGASVASGGGAATVVRITNTTITSSVDASNRGLRIVTRGVGDLLLDTIYMDCSLALSGTNGEDNTGTRVRNLFLRVNYSGNPINTGGSTFRIAEFDRVLRITTVVGPGSTGAFAYMPGGDMTRLVGLVAANSNPHFFSGPAGISGQNDSIDGAYIEQTGASMDGDAFVGPAGPATLTTVKNVVVACNPTTGYSTSLSSNALPTTKTFSLLNNTYCGKDDGSDSRGFGFEVAGTAAVGFLASARNNIVFCATSTICYLVRKGPTGTAQAGTYQNVDYNWQWNVSTTPYFDNSGGNYSPAPGTHDTLATDPQFVQQRHFIDWCQLLDASITTWDGCAARFASMNDDSGYDSRFTIQAAYDWLRAGYAPQNAAVMTAGDTGGRVGAMDAATPTGTPSSMLTGAARVSGAAVIK